MLQWNVYNLNHNADQIKVFNIFNHSRFNAEVEQLLISNANYSDFEKELKHICMYYFWSKYEYEIILSSFPHKKKTEMKIDVYDQLRLNWENFVSYLYSKKEEYN